MLEKIIEGVTKRIAGIRDYLFYSPSPSSDDSSEESSGERCNECGRGMIEIDYGVYECADPDCPSNK